MNRFLRRYTFLSFAPVLSSCITQPYRTLLDAALYYIDGWIRPSYYVLSH